MLRKIISEFRNNGAMSMAELSQRLNIEHGVLDGMVDELLKKGKIKEVDNDSPACAFCSKKSTCYSSQSVFAHGRTFILND
jgi:predicted transcriptional regulator